MTRAEKARAWHAVNVAIRRGILSRRPCEVCGAERHIHAHHDDYAKPLEVRWLCAKHHIEAHGGWHAMRGLDAPEPAGARQ